MCALRLRKALKHYNWRVPGNIVCFGLSLLCFITVCRGQYESGQKLNTNIYKDTFSINKAIKRADSLTETKPDSAMRLSEFALSSSRSMNFYTGVVKSLGQIGVQYMVRSEYAPAIKALKEGIVFCDSIKTDAGNAKRLNYLVTIASCYWYMGKADSTAYFCYKALEDIEKRQITRAEAILPVYVKILHLWLNLNEGAEHFFNDKYINNAISYLNKAELLTLSNPAMKSQIVYGRAQIKEMQKDYDSARFYYKMYLELKEKGGIHHSRKLSWNSAMLLNISNTFLYQNKPDSAIWYADLAIKDLPTEGNKTMIPYLVYAGYYKGRAYFLKADFNRAVSLTEAAIKMAGDKNIYFLREFAHRTLADAYNKTKDFGKAFLHLTAYNSINDSLKQVSKLQTISQMEMKYQVAEMNKEIAEKELAIITKDNKIKQKNLWLLGFGSGMVFLVLGIFVFYSRVRYRQQLTAMKTAQEIEYAKMQALIDGEEKERKRLARELHDGIGGQIGNLKMQLDTALMNSNVEDRKGDFRNLKLLINDTYNELRKTSHNLIPEVLLHEGFVKAAEIYCKNMAKGARFDLHFESLGPVPPLKSLESLVLYRALQELLNNIVKHANASEVFVQIAYTNHLLGISVDDNGSGFDTDKQKTSDESGLGLFAIVNRIKSIGGTMMVSSKINDGTSINIEIPVESANVL
ncbi:ATP-binding protein [Polluticaenibacter yanchengensis]|uniref:Oxygen sensor histidine kinase NreB n=1 Tax=Polluticaenibacter yanchengensis TaxID=3014562 RepID=A0ABT4UIQ9_9BACT|nr:sensor histidine kinase [Chitinophagaceae bacterium LY-5]